MQFDYSRHYRRWHDMSDGHFAAQSAASSALLMPYLPQDKRAAILELGCGMGFALAGVCRRGFTNAEGIDADRSQIEASRRRGLNATLVPIDKTLLYLGERHATYDFIYSMDVLEHIPTHQLVDVLATILKCLKPGGTFYCSVPNCNSIVATRMRYIDWTHYTLFSEASLDFVLYNAGFEKIRVIEERPSFSLQPHRILQSLARKVIRFFYRIILATEISPREAFSIPLSPNIIGLAESGRNAAQGE